MTTKEDVPDSITDKELRDLIRENYKQSVESRDFKKLNSFIRKYSKIINAKRFFNEFKNALSDQRTELNNSIKYLEPRYSIFREALDAVAKQSPALFMDKIKNPPNVCLLRNEIFNAFIIIKREGRMFADLEEQDKIDKEIHLIQKCWELYKSQRNLMCNMLEEINNPSMKEYVREKAKLHDTKLSRNIRNADSHLRVQNFPERRMVHLRNLRNDKIDWEDDIPYDDFEDIFYDLLNFNNAMATAEEEVSIGILEQMVKSR